MIRTLILVMKYEDIRVALSVFAGKGKVNLSFQVVPTPQGLKVTLRNSLII